MTRADRIALVLVAAFTMLSVALGLHVGDSVRDVDEVVYEHTLVAMQHGQGYYPAMRAALIEKEHAPPTQIRSIRPPTMYLVLARIPASAWRWVVGLVYLSTLLLAWRLGRSLSMHGGPVAVGITGAWMVGACLFVYLHAELWGLPFLLAGVLAMRNEHWRRAAGFLLIAALIRETYAIAFLAGLVFAKERRWWWPALGAFAVLGGVHAVLAHNVLSAHGRETPFGASGLSLRYILSAISPGPRPVAWVVGAVGSAIGALGLRARWSHDRGARVVGVFAAAMYPATILLGRTYWGLAFVPAISTFVPAGEVALQRTFAGASRALRPARPASS